MNLQTGKFRYWPYSFEMGLFRLERGFGKSGFQFLGSSYWYSRPTATGTAQPQIVFKLGDTRLEFTRDTSGAYTPWNAAAATSGWHLERSGAGHLLVDRSGNTYYFADYGSAGGYATPPGRGTQVVFADGSTIDATYDASGSVQWLQSSRGYAVRYETLSDGAQIKMCGFNLAQVYANANTSCSSSSYVVTTNYVVNQYGSLQASSYVDVMGRTSTVNYTAGATQCITLPDSSTCEFTNTYGDQPGEYPHTRAGQVRIQTDALGRQYTYDYINPSPDDPPRYPGGPPTINESLFSVPGSPVTNGAFPYYAHFEDGLLTYLQAPGRGPNQFAYNGVDLKTVIYPEGNKLTINRDGAGNATSIIETPKPNSGDSPITRTQTFATPNVYYNPSVCQAAAKLCDKPITQVDGRGNQTDYTYDPAHGGVLTASGPADPNGVRPVRRYAYAQRYAWIKTSSGSYAQASAPIWVKTQERTCNTSATVGNACAAGSGDEVVTTYEYGPDSGPNNLLLRGIAVTAGGTTLRTCYSYDANGRKLSETTPNANLSVCP